ncbi:MAG: hypothetical protein PVH34_14375, partial [Syntrophobacterales bacterium]
IFINETDIYVVFSQNLQYGCSRVAIPTRQKKSERRKHRALEDSRDPDFFWSRGAYPAHDFESFALLAHMRFATRGTYPFGPDLLFNVGHLK